MTTNQGGIAQPIEPIEIPRFENAYNGRKVHCWLNASMTSIIFLVKLINMAFGNESMDVDGNEGTDVSFEDYVKGWLSLTRSIVVSPTMAILAFSRQFHYQDQGIISEMQDVGQVFQSFLGNPVHGTTGSVHFSFMQPELIEIQSYTACSNCGQRRPNQHQAPFCVATVRIPLSLRADRRDMKKIIEDYFNGVLDRRDGPLPTVRCNQPCQNDQVRVTTKFIISDPKEAIIFYLGNFPSYLQLSSVSKFHLGRAQFGPSARTKAIRRIPLGADISLPTIESGVNVDYELVATVQHFGSANSGNNLHQLITSSLTPFLIHRSYCKSSQDCHWLDDVQ